MEDKKQELLDSFPPKKSERYELLQSVVRQAFQASRKHFNVDAVMTDIYQDVDAFGGKGNLRTLIDRVLDEIDQKVWQEMDQYAKEEKIEQQLLLLERITLKLDLEWEWKQFLDEQDRLAAQKAVEQLDKLKLPEGYTKENFINFQMYQKLSSKEAELQAQLDEINTEIGALEQENQATLKALEPQRQAMAELAKEMEKAADKTSEITK